MLRALSLAALALTSFNAHAAEGCADFNIAGAWQNGWGVQWQIDQPSCNEVILRDVSHGNAEYRIKLDGRTETVIPGDRVLNAPALDRWLSASSETNAQHLSLLRDLRITGRLDHGVTNTRSVNKVAHLHIVADFALPVPGKPKHFYGIRGSVEAEVGAGLDGSVPATTDYIWSQLTHVKIEALEGRNAEPLPTAHRAFIAGMNAIVSLFNYPVSSPGVYTDLSGPHPFGSLVDWKSLTLTGADSK